VLASSYREIIISFLDAIRTHTETMLQRNEEKSIISSLMEYASTVSINRWHVGQVQQGYGISTESTHHDKIQVLQEQLVTLHQEQSVLDQTL